MEQEYIKWIHKTGRKKVRSYSPFCSARGPLLTEKKKALERVSALVQMVSGVYLLYVVNESVSDIPGLFSVAALPLK